MHDNPYPFMGWINGMKWVEIWDLEWPPRHAAMELVGMYVPGLRVAPVPRRPRLIPQRELKSDATVCT